MQSMRGVFNVLLSATPAFNHIEDVKGMLSFLLDPKNEALWDDHNPPADYDPFAANADPEYKPLLFTLRGLNKWVWNKKGLDSLGMAVSLMSVWEQCVIRRTVNSRIPFIDGKLVGENIPPAIRKVVLCTFTPLEQRQYNMFAAPPLANLVEKIPSGGCVWHMDQFRMLTLLNTWIGAQYTHQSLTARNSASLACQLDDKGSLGKLLAHKALPKSLQIRKRMMNDARSKKEGIETLEEGIHKVPKDANDLDPFLALNTLLFGAPKMREWLKRVRLEVHHLGEKSIVWCSNPGQQFLAAAVLNLAGISCDVYHADLTSSQRSALVKGFNEGPYPMVLVCSYYVNSAGCNMQEQCRNVHLLCTPMGIPIATQAVGRVRRLGQQKLVKVYEYRLEKSFDEEMVNNNIAKAIPALALSLNDANFKFHMDPGASGQVMMDPYLLNSDGTISDVDKIWFPYLHKSCFVAPDVFLNLILRAQSDSKPFRRPKDQVPDAIAKLLSSYGPDDFPENCETASDVYQLPLGDLEVWLKANIEEMGFNILQASGKTLDTMS